MDKILERIAKYLKRGFASADEKAKLASDIAKLKEADQEALEDKAEQVEDLPEEKPAGAPEEEEEEEEEVDEEIEKGIKALFGLESKKLSRKLDSFKTDIKSWLEEQQSLIAQKSGVYNPEMKGKRKELNTYLRELSLALANDDKAKIKEMTTSSSSPSAGYTIDTELSAEIRHLTTEYGVARREMEVLQLTKGSYKANDLVTDVSVYWADEAAAILSTQAVIGQEELTLKKLAVIVTLTSELLEDTEIDFVSFLASRVAEGFAQAEDEAFFKGDGTSTYGSFTGLLNATDVNEVTMTGTTFASMDADDLIAMVDATPQGAHRGGKFYMHRTIMSLVRKLKDSQNQYIYQPISESGPATIWGYPVVLVEAMPSTSDTAVDTSFVLFGNLRRACILGHKGAINVKRFDAGTVRNVANNADINLITTDREAVRWTQRVGYIRIIPTAVTKLTTAAASA